MDSDRLWELQRATAAGRLRWPEKALSDALEALAGDRQFAALAEVAERAARFTPDEPRLRRMQAQALIETGWPATALSVIDSVPVPDGHEEESELLGLRGRACKQMFLDAGDGGGGRESLAKAIAAYRRGFERFPECYWHGVNLLALESLAAGEASDETRALAGRLVDIATRSASAGDDPWAHAAIAECSVALGDVAAAETQIRRFLASSKTRAFHVGSLLRQLVQVWRLDDRGEEWRGIVTALRAKHASMPGADATLLRPGDLRLQRADGDSKLQFERILGPDGGLVTFRWWKQVLERATGVVAVRKGRDRTIGTAFAVDGGDLTMRWRGRVVLLTNHHVVNREGQSPGVRPETARLVFEAVDKDACYRIERILWESPPGEFDCTILLPEGVPAGVGVMPLADYLPVVDDKAPTRVFIIGHPNGRGIEFSINDNNLICHDADAKRPVTRLHYRAPTEPGSSGSPVFSEDELEVLAIHHGCTGTPLDARPDDYEANEGIGLSSIRAALAAVEDSLPQLPPG